MKIIVIGAGQGGLQAARTLSQGNAEVTVYEKCSRDSLSYDWIDDVETGVFDELSIPVPKGHFHTGSPSFVAPFSEKPLKVEVEESLCDWSVERRRLSKILVELAENAGAKIIFDTAVDSLIIENNRVSGVYVNGEKLYADLVIDSSGALSPFRASLPASYRVQPKPDFDEVFRVYRVFLKPAEGVELPTVHTKKIYLKHLGEDGISWCFVEPDGEINVLIGRIGKIDNDVIERSMAALREDNPIIGIEITRGDTVCTIPIRYPLSRMVGDGYAAVGDSAFMTIPMIGSGIASSLRAGQMLAETVLESGKTDVKSLWSYQYRFYKKIGAGHVGIDLIKRMLLSADANGLRMMFDNGVIDQNIMNGIATGGEVPMSPATIIRMVIRGRKILGLLLKFKSAIGKSEKAEAFAGTIPKVFDEKTVSAWQEQLESYFKK